MVKFPNINQYFLDWDSKTYSQLEVPLTASSLADTVKSRIAQDDALTRNRVEDCLSRSIPAKGHPQSTDSLSR